MRECKKGICIVRAVLLCYCLRGNLQRLKLKLFKIFLNPPPLSFIIPKCFDKAECCRLWCIPSPFIGDWITPEEKKTRKKLDYDNNPKEGETLT